MKKYNFLIFWNNKQIHLKGEKRRRVNNYRMLKMNDMQEILPLLE